MDKDKSKRWYKKLCKKENVKFEDVCREKHILAIYYFSLLAFFYNSEITKPPIRIKLSDRMQKLLAKPQRRIKMQGRIVLKHAGEISDRIFTDDEFFSQKIDELSKTSFTLPDKIEKLADIENLFCYACTLYRFWEELENLGWKDEIALKVCVIDLSMAKFIKSAEQFMNKRGNDHHKKREKLKAVYKRVEGKNKKVNKRKQQVMEAYYTISGRSKMRPYELAKIIQKRYIPTGPKDKIPSERTIVRYLK